MNLLGLPFSKIKASVSASPVGLLSSSFKFSLLDSFYEARTKIELDRLQFKNLIVEDFQFKEAEVSESTFKRLTKRVRATKVAKGLTQQFSQIARDSLDISAGSPD